MSRVPSRRFASLPARTLARRTLISAALAAPALWQGRVQAQPRERVELLIDWKPSPTYAGFFLAQQTGAFERRGLDVEIVIGHGASASAEWIGRGDGTWIGASSGAATAIARSKGAPIRSLAVYYRDTPTVIYSLAGSGIVKPQDLLGRRIGLVPGSITVEEYRALLMANRLDRARITEVEVGWDSSALLDGKVDALIDYMEIAPAELMATLVPDGRKLDILRLADFGVDCYSLNLIVNATAWADPKRRPVARKIAEALAEAYDIVRARPEAASVAFKVLFPALSPRYIEIGMADVARQLGAPPAGAQTRAGWQKTLATLGGLGLLQQPLVPGEVAIFAD